MMTEHNLTIAYLIGAGITFLWIYRAVVASALDRAPRERGMAYIVGAVFGVVIATIWPLWAALNLLLTVVTPARHRPQRTQRSRR